MVQPGSRCSPEGALPSVSVFLTVLNEQAHLAESLGSVLDQDYEGAIEVVVALGPSTDSTDQIAQDLAEGNARVRLVPNPTGRIPEGLNAAWRACSHQYLIRTDGHAVLPKDYLRQAVATLETSGAANVGGMMVPEGTTAFEMAVAHAMSTPVGIGAVSFHTGGRAGPAKSVYLGCFRRDWLEQVGGYDESFARAEDWELNYRIIQAGGVVLFDPSLRVAYRPRGNLMALARQYFSTGQWRAEVMRVHPKTLSLRYLAPPAVVIAVAVGSLVGLWGTLRGSKIGQMGWAVPAMWAVGEAAAALVDGRGLPPVARAWLPVVMATMHLCWGLSFLRGMVRSPGKVRVE